MAGFDQPRNGVEESSASCTWRGRRQHQAVLLRGIRRRRARAGVRSRHPARSRAAYILSKEKASHTPFQKRVTFRTTDITLAMFCRKCSAKATTRRSSSELIAALRKRRALFRVVEAIARSGLTDRHGGQCNAPIVTMRLRQNTDVHNYTRRKTRTERLERARSSALSCESTQHEEAGSSHRQGSGQRGRPGDLLRRPVRKRVSAENQGVGGSIACTSSLRWRLACPASCTRQAEQPASTKRRRRVCGRRWTDTQFKRRLAEPGRRWLKCEQGHADTGVSNNITS